MSFLALFPLRQRMIEDMRMRKLAPQTQAAYIRAVRKFARYLNRAPDTATAEDLRNFQLHLVDHGASPITLNATITGLKFFPPTSGRGIVYAGCKAFRVQAACTSRLSARLHMSSGPKAPSKKCCRIPPITFRMRR